MNSVNNSIYIYQKNWAFTSSASQKPKIKTGSFGPCYVVTFTSGKFAAMAHIDDNTDVDSMTSIFDAFRQNSVALKDVKVIVLGGWKEHAESFNWGNKIVKKIHDAGFENVSTKKMYSKKMVTDLERTQKISLSNLGEYYHFGALVNSLNGKTFLLKECSYFHEKKQKEKIEEFAKNHSFNLDSTEIPLSQVTD